MTLAPNAFSQEGYFKAYVKYVQHPHQAQGQDPELVDFNPPITDEDGQGDEETTPLDGETETPDDEGNEVATHGDSDDDEDPPV